MRGMMLPQRLRRLADLAFAGQEHEDVALAPARQLVRRVADRVVEIVVVAIRLDRVVADLHGIEPPRNLDDRRRSSVRLEMLRETLRVDRRGSDDELKIRTPRQELLYVPEQEVDVEAALVRLVDDQRVVLAKLAVSLRLGEQDAVGHDLDVGARTRPCR